MRKLWTDEDRETALRLAREGVSLQDAAAQLKRTPRAVQLFWTRNGVRRSQWNDEEVAAFVTCWTEGMPYTEIAERFGRTRSWVTWMRRKHKLPQRKSSPKIPMRPWQEDELAILRADFGAQSIGRLAARLNRTPEGISAQATRMGIVRPSRAEAAAMRGYARRMPVLRLFVENGPMSLAAANILLRGRRRSLLRVLCYDEPRMLRRAPGEPRFGARWELTEEGVAYYELHRGPGDVPASRRVGASPPSVDKVCDLP